VKQGRQCSRHSRALPPQYVRSYESGSRAYLHAVIDNFSLRILGWNLTSTFAPAATVEILRAGRCWLSPPMLIGTRAWPRSGR
jgi:transposase InsO family protein